MPHELVLHTRSASIRDPDYYEEDGNLILCAGDVLFKAGASPLVAATNQLTPSLDATLATDAVVCYFQGNVRRS
jgi:hypothetical protein